MTDHPYGWLSIAPPLLAVVLAIATRRVMLPLVAGLAMGALITSGGHPVTALVALLETHLWATFIQPDKLRLFAFTMAIGATIGVVSASGGMHALVNGITPWARSRRSGQLVTWGLGLLVFFDDYANTLILGSTMRPTCERLRISREKLAYVVDSTAAPVAGLAIISTWIAIEIDYVRDGLGNLDPQQAAGLNPFELFLACIPYRFYVIQALVFVPLVALLRRDFGPMLAAERRAASASPAPSEGQPPDALAGEEAVRPTHWTNAVVPLAVTLGMVLWLIYATGTAAIDSPQQVAAPDTQTEQAVASEPTGLARVRLAFGNGDSSLALYYGGLGGLAVAAGLARWRAGLSSPRIWEAAWRGARVVLPALLILWLAGAMSRMTGNRSVDGAASVTPYEYSAERLYTGDFLKDRLVAASDSATAAFATWLPTIVFLLAAVVSFCTGTSFGTMGILVPMVIPLAAATLGVNTPEALAGSPIFLCALGSVLAGAVFGDHCSPISDTTILSSQASGCGHMAHVATQLPYALTVAVVSTLLGTVLIGYGASVWLLLPLQTAALVGVLLLVGKSAQ